MIYPIATYPWPLGYEPRAEARLELAPDGLNVELIAWEREIVGTETKIGGAVSRDSCLEFFFMPCPDADARYINIEVNATGCAHIGIGDGRHGRTVLTELPEGLRPVVTINAGERWAVRYAVPHEFIRSYFPEYAPTQGYVMRGNFYCCDESIHPHFGCWSPVCALTPDFHRPECFASIML